AKHASSMAWNEQRGRFVQIVEEIYGTPSLLGELWYAEGDTPMGPWVYTRKVVTHDNYSFYNPRLHPYFDQERGRRIFFEATYTATFTDAVPTPRADYNQVMHQLDLDDERLALPVAVYDLGQGRPGDFTTKAGLRRDQAAAAAPFFAFDRQVTGGVPVYWSNAACRERTLVAGGTATTPALFWALPAGQSPAPPDAIPLYRYRNASTRQEAYSIAASLALSGFTRIGSVALVFRNPIAVSLPVADYLPSLLAHAGADRCAAELAPGAGVVLPLDGSASSHASGTVASYTWRYRIGGVEQVASGVAPRVRLPAGLHAIELTAEGSDGSISRDQVLVSVAAGQSPFTLSCAGQPGLDYETRWSATPFLGGYAYALQSVRGPGGSTDPSGFVLHHRPSEGFPNNVYAADTQVRDGAVLGYSVWSGLLPRVSSPFSPPVALSTLTCPGGACVFSFERGCEPTYAGPSSAAKVAVTGDSLIWGPQLCGFAPPPEGCAPSLSQVLNQRGYKVWSKSEAGQSFVNWLDVVREQATTAPAVHVLALGTNDAFGQAGAAAGQPREDRAWQTVGSASAAIDAIRAANSAACVVLVTVSEKALLNGQLYTAYRDEARRVNDLLAYFATSANLPNVRIADWASATRAHCPATWLTSATTTCDYFGADQLHMGRTGNEARNALILDTIAHCTAR
ncbi:MAG TPA: SGNH/GDSL hydrolase family protein, partial [Polyangiales bacterium]|nr:SGNH/GDSL hydrolase family protein [Polyangiales bacterium]